MVAEEIAEVIAEKIAEVDIISKIQEAVEVEAEAKVTSKMDTKILTKVQKEEVTAVGTIRTSKIATKNIKSRKSNPKKALTRVMSLKKSRPPSSLQTSFHCSQTIEWE